MNFLGVVPSVVKGAKEYYGLFSNLRQILES